MPECQAPRFDHIIEIDETARVPHIYRYAENRKTLFTSAPLPANSIADNRDAFREFATLVGENVLFDSPTARRLLGL